MTEWDVDNHNDDVVECACFYWCVFHSSLIFVSFHLFLFVCLFVYARHHFNKFRHGFITCYFLGKMSFQDGSRQNYETVSKFLNLSKLCRENCRLFFRTRCIRGSFKSL